MFGVDQPLVVHRRRLVDAVARADGHLERRPPADETVRLRRLPVGADDVSDGKPGRVGLFRTPGEQSFFAILLTPGVNFMRQKC